MRRDWVMRRGWVAGAAVAAAMVLAGGFAYHARQAAAGLPPGYA
jgi:hypothetical protein